VGNLSTESGVLPSRVQGSTEAAPLRTDGRDWSPREVMDRAPGAAHDGIGLAQWTWAPRRTGLFAYVYGTAPAGPRILFDMDAQIDYLVHELRTAADFAKSEAVLMTPEVTLDDACDEFLYNVEKPKAVYEKDNLKKRLARDSAALQAVLAGRRPRAREALQAYTDGQ
jgi:hypothetical protein